MSWANIVKQVTTAIRSFRSNRKPSPASCLPIAFPFLTLKDGDAVTSATSHLKAPSNVSASLTPSSENETASPRGLAATAGKESRGSQIANTLRKSNRRRAQYRKIQVRR